MIKIISDSTCDLSQEVLEKYDIDIIPLHIVKGNEELEDGPAIDISALYKWADENKTTPKTSAPSIETAMNIMRPYIEANAIQLSIISVVFCHREPLFFMPKNFKNITKNS